MRKSRPRWLKELAPRACPPAREAFSPQKLDLLRKGKLHMSRGTPVPHGDRTEVLPDTVDHRADNYEGPIKNQGAVGSCTAFSLSTVMDNAILRLQGGRRWHAEHDG